LFSFFQFYPRHSTATKKQASLVLRGWKNDFTILPFGVWQSLIWRGHKYEAAPDSYIFVDSPISNWESTLVNEMKINERVFQLNLPGMLTYVISSRGENFVRRVVGKVKKQAYLFLDVFSREKDFE
jgi:hypothetical protein